MLHQTVGPEKDSDLLLQKGFFSVAQVRQTEGYFSYFGDGFEPRHPFRFFVVVGEDLRVGGGVNGSAAKAGDISQDYVWHADFSKM